MPWVIVSFCIQFPNTTAVSLLKVNKCTNLATESMQKHMECYIVPYLQIVFTTNNDVIFSNQNCTRQYNFFMHELIIPAPHFHISIIKLLKLFNISSTISKILFPLTTIHKFLCPYYHILFIPCMPMYFIISIW